MASHPPITNPAATGSAFLAALTGQPIAYEGPVRSNDEITAALEAAKKAYSYAEARHQIAVAVSVIAYHEGRPFAIDGKSAEYVAFEQAADRLVNAAVPAGPRALKAAVCWKREALRRFTLNRSDKPEWREIIAADEARLPAPKPRIRHTV